MGFISIKKLRNVLPFGRGIWNWSKLSVRIKEANPNESKNEKSKITGLNSIGDAMMPLIEGTKKNIFHHEKNPSSVMEGYVYIYIYRMFCVKKPTVQHLTIKKSGANFLLVFKQGTFF